MLSMRTSPVWTAAAVAALVLAACTPSGSPSPSPTPSTSPSATSLPSPTPSVTATAVPAPPVGDLVISTQGLLPLTIGVAPETNPGAAMITFDANACYSEEMGITEGDLGRWVTTYPLGTGLYGPSSVFAVGVNGGQIERIDIGDVSLATAEGIHIGSTLGELMEVYPVELQGGSGGITSHVWWIEDAHGYVVFESQNEADWEAEPDIEDTIILIRVLAAGSDPDWGAANSGNVAGACF